MRLVLVLAMLSCLVASCKEPDKTDYTVLKLPVRWSAVYVYDGVVVITDPDSGCQYLVQQRGGITPRLDSCYPPETP